MITKMPSPFIIIHHSSFIIHHRKKIVATKSTVKTGLVHPCLDDASEPCAAVVVAVTTTFPPFRMDLEGNFAFRIVVVVVHDDAGAALFRATFSRTGDCSRLESGANESVAEEEKRAACSVKFCWVGGSNVGIGPMTASKSAMTAVVLSLSRGGSCVRLAPLSADSAVVEESSLFESVC